MKKYLILWFFALLFSGCGKKEERIKFWHFWSEPSQAKVIREIINEFEKQNNCRVDVSELSWNDGKTKLIIAFNSRTAPDVLELGSDWIAQFSSAEVLEPVDANFFSRRNFFEYTLQPAETKGKLYALPWIIGTRVLFCNRDLMKKCRIENPPKTIDELIQFSRTINESGFGYGFGCNGSDPHRLYKKILPLIWTLGGEIQDSSGNIRLNSPQVARAFQTYFELSRLGIIETQKQIDLLFVQGKIGFCFSGEWLLELIQKSPQKFNFSTNLMPGIGNTPGISFAGGEYLAINKESKNKDLAKKLIQFLLSEHSLKKLLTKIPEAGFPADTILLYKSLNDLNFHKRIFAEQLKYAKMTPVHPRWIEIESIIEKSLVEVLYQKKGVYEALSEAQREIDLYNKGIQF